MGERTRQIVTRRWSDPVTAECCDRRTRARDGSDVRPGLLQAAPAVHTVATRRRRRRTRSSTRDAERSRAEISACDEHCAAPRAPTGIVGDGGVLGDVSGVHGRCRVRRGGPDCARRVRPLSRLIATRAGGAVVACDGGGTRTGEDGEEGEEGRVRCRVRAASPK
jgi:hypothetical protein